MEDSGCRRREDGHPGPETALLLLHSNAADSLNDIWRKAQEAEIRDADEGLKHHEVKASQ